MHKDASGTGVAHHGLVVQRRLVRPEKDRCEATLACPDCDLTALIVIVPAASADELIGILMTGHRRTPAICHDCAMGYSCAAHDPRPCGEQYCGADGRGPCPSCGWDPFGYGANGGTAASA